METLNKLPDWKDPTAKDFNALVDMLNTLAKIVEMHEEILNALSKLDARRTHTEDRRGAKPL